MNKKLYTCHCCGFMIFEEVFSEYEICPICFFEDSILNINEPFNEPYASKGHSFIFLQQKILKKIPLNIKEIDFGWKTYYRNPLWKPVDFDKIDKKHDYFPRYKFEEFKEKYPKHYNYFEKLMIKAQKYNPDEKVHWSN